MHAIIASLTKKRGALFLSNMKNIAVAVPIIVERHTDMGIEEFITCKGSSIG